MEFDFINGYTAKPGDHYDFLLANSLFGWDTLSFTVDGFDTGLESSTMYIDHKGRLLITAQNPVPEPSTMLLLASGLLGLAELSYRSA